MRHTHLLSGVLDMGDQGRPVSGNPLVWCTLKLVNG